VTGSCLPDVVRVTLVPPLFFSEWKLSQGKVPFLSARLAPDSTFSLPIPIMYISMFELATRHNGQGFFCLVGRVVFCSSRAADHTITSAVERQARGRFHFHTFCASAVVDDAVYLPCCMQRPCDISIVDWWKMHALSAFPVRPYHRWSLCVVLINYFACTFHRCSCCFVFILRTNGSADEIPVLDTEMEEWPIPSKQG
jgi:hypothetical protein